MPTWDEKDQTLAKGIQRELGRPDSGLDARGPGRLRGTGERGDAHGRRHATTSATCRWNVPTVTLHYPSNIPGLPGHNWANAIAMATPIAHKGVVAGAKVQAMTVLDSCSRRQIVDRRVGLLQQRADEGR